MEIVGFTDTRKTVVTGVESQKLPTKAAGTRWAAAARY